MIDTAKLLQEVPNYKEFLTVDEMNKRAHTVTKKYNFEISEAGYSTNNQSIFLITAGSGEKRLFIWGFPHPNEAIGSWTVDWLINYIGNHKEMLQEYTWYFMYTADPDGSQLNEKLFKGNLNLQKYILNFYRPPGCRQMEWTFPIKYKNFEWKETLPETEVMMKMINNIKPDLMYPLHNAGLGAAYFFSTQPFDELYYHSIIENTQNLGIPLEMGEPEEPFMVPIKKPVYYDFGLKDYYEYHAKIGNDPCKFIKAGDNSSAYLLDIKPEAAVIKGEIPYFYDPACADTTASEKTRRDVWKQVLSEADKRNAYFKKIIPSFLQKLKEPDPFYYVLKEIERQAQRGNENMKKHVEESREYDRKATKAEVFWGDIIVRFYATLLYGQLHRSASNTNQKKIAANIKIHLSKEINYLNTNANIKVFSIQKLVQLQLLMLFETLNALHRGQWSKDKN